MMPDNTVKYFIGFAILLSIAKIVFVVTQGFSAWLFFGFIALLLQTFTVFVWLRLLQLKNEMAEVQSHTLWLLNNIALLSSIVQQLCMEDSQSVEQHSMKVPSFNVH